MPENKVNVSLSIVFNDKDGDETHFTKNGRLTIDEAVSWLRNVEEKRKKAQVI